MQELFVLYVDGVMLCDYLDSEGAMAYEHAARLAAKGKHVVVKREMHDCTYDD